MTHPDPFIQVPITDPRKKEDLFYSPLGIYGGNDIVLYKSKEIQTLDDGSKKTITLPPPSIEGVVPFTGASGTPASASHSWWSGFWCFIKCIFGKSC